MCAPEFAAKNLYAFNFGCKTGLTFCVTGVFLVLLNMVYLQPGWSLDVNDMPGTLRKLEIKFFRHDYAADKVPDRLDRIEQMVFGESKSGSESERLKALVAVVPDLDQVAEPVASSSGGPADDKSDQSSGSNKEKSASRKLSDPNGKPPLDYNTETPDDIPNQSSYPVVTELERKILGKDYIGESVAKRLSRLEMKAFGKTSSSDDLSERVDKLSTVVGLKAKPPSNADWSDEDDLDMLPATNPYKISDSPAAPSYGSAYGEDGRSFSGRDLRRDMEVAFGRRATDGNGSFGMGGGAAAANGSGSFGMGASSASAMPKPAPGFSGSAPNTVQPSGMGLSQQVAMLEKEVFQKVYDKDTIPSRLKRLESTVFPQDKSSEEKSIPDRVQHLLAAVPLSSAPAGGGAQSRRPKPYEEDFDGEFFEEESRERQSASGYSQPQRGGGGLSKIINGLSSLLGSGYASGAYGAQPGTLVPDPQTGLLYDQYTGSLIDPSTGAVVGRKMMPNMMNPYGFGGYNSGFAPMNGFGMGGGSMGFGIGGGGMRFGSGMWP